MKKGQKQVRRISCITFIYCFLLISCKKDIQINYILFQTNTNITSKDLLKNGFNASKLDVNRYEKNINDTLWTYYFDNSGKNLHNESVIIEMENDNELFSKEFIKYLNYNNCLIIGDVDLYANGSIFCVMNNTTHYIYIVRISNMADKKTIIVDYYYPPQLDILKQ